MKTLYLIRHAKSDWDNADLHDIERPLNNRGYANAKLMSQNFKGSVDLIISSPAIRAMSTALIFARNLSFNVNAINIRQELYESSVENYLSVIQSIDNRFKSVMLFGHNPVISDSANALTNSMPVDMPTCAMAGIRFTTEDWRNTKTGELFLFDYFKKD